MLFVLLGFMIVMLVGAFLLALPVSNTDGEWLPFTHAIFWATNGVCGTGLVSALPRCRFRASGKPSFSYLSNSAGSDS